MQIENWASKNSKGINTVLRDSAVTKVKWNPKTKTLSLLASGEASNVDRRYDYKITLDSKDLSLLLGEIARAISV